MKIMFKSHDIYIIHKGTMHGRTICPTVNIPVELSTWYTSKYSPYYYHKTQPQTKTKTW